MGQQVFSGFLNKGVANYSDESLEVSSPFYLLEHLSEPVKSPCLLGRYFSALGCLYIKVPNALRMSGSNYMFFKAHTLYFTDDSLCGYFRKPALLSLRKTDPKAGTYAASLYTRVVRLLSDLQQKAILSFRRRYRENGTPI